MHSLCCRSLSQIHFSPNFIEAKARYWNRLQKARTFHVDMLSWLKEFHNSGLFKTKKIYIYMSEGRLSVSTSRVHYTSNKQELVWTRQLEALSQAEQPLVSKSA